MTDIQERFFLLIGAARLRDPTTDKLRVSGIPYKWKRLDSGPENWKSILSLLHNPSIMGVIGRLSGHVYSLIASPAYQEVAGPLFHALGNVAHVMFVHEALLTGEAPESPDDYEEGSEEYNAAMVQQDFFNPPPETVLETVKKLFETYRINVVPYRTNAELSVLSSAFIDDHEKNLLFRVYVPSGRLYATEADKLLSLFQDWLNRVGRHNVRQEGYRTAAGEVYEFFGDTALASGQLSREFDNFSDFLDMCVEDAPAAADMLLRAGIDRQSVSDMVMRYGKEVRRLQLDLRQQRESRMLAIRHTLESELVEAGNESFMPQVDELIDALVPDARDIAPMHLLTLALPESSRSPTAPVIINQQVISAVYGAVIQNIQGTANIGSEAKELLRLVGQFGGQDTSVLESAVHELEDQNARVSDRLGARQRLKGFLIQLGGKVEDAALAILQAYVQNKMGI